MKILKRLIMPLFLIFICMNANSETTIRLLGVGSDDTEQPLTVRSSNMALASCSQAVAQASLEFDESLNNGNYSLNPGAPMDRQHLGRTYHYLGGVDSPQLAIIDQNRVLIQDLDIFNWNYRGIEAASSPIALFRIENSENSPAGRRFSDYYFTLYTDYPQTTDRDRVQIIDSNFASRTQIPLERSVDFLNRDAISDPSQLRSVQEMIASSLRQTMDNFVSSMRGNIENRSSTSDLVTTASMYEFQFRKFQNAFCTCKDLPAFSGFESTTINVLLGDEAESKNTSNFSLLDDDSLLERRNPTGRRLNHSDLNCNFS